jgi:hypothetical protein
MENQATFYVYEHWRLDRDECFYVGKGKGGRAYSMKNRNKHHQAVCAKLGRIGSAFEVKIVASGLFEEDSFLLERERIAFWRATGVDLTNQTDGGDGVSGFVHSNETKKLWSHQRKGRPVSEEGKVKRSNTLKGRAKTKEHAMAAGKAGGIARKGMKQNPDWVSKRVETRKVRGWNEMPSLQKPVICITDCIEFKSVSDASRHYNIPKDYVSSVCRGKRKHTRNLVFKFKELA